MKKNRFFSFKKYFEQFNQLKKRLSEMITDGSFYKLKSFDKNWLMQKFEKTFAKLERIRVRTGLKLAGTALAFALITNVANSQTYVPAGTNNPFVNTENPFNGLLNGNPMEMNVQFVQMVDIDNDGDLDLINSFNVYKETNNAFYQKNKATKTIASTLKNQKNWTSDLRFFENIGDQSNPKFELKTSNPFSNIDLGTANINNSLLADFDNDADFDLVTSYRENDSIKFKYFENQGTPELADFNEQIGTDNPLFGLSFYEYIGSPAMNDLDGDSDLDLLISSTDTCILYFENQGTPELANFVSVASNPFQNIYSYVAKPELVDIDNDGDLDLFASTYSDKQSGINYYKNIGSDQTPVFELQTGEQDPLNDFQMNAYLYFPNFADLDADGDFDIVMPIFYDLSAYSGGDPIFYLKNIGSQTVAEFELLANLTTGMAAKADFVDLDNDDDLDLIYGEEYGKLVYFENTGNSQIADFDEVNFYDSPFYTLVFGDELTPLLSDLDNDGDFDLALHNKIYNSTTNTFESKISYFKNTGSASNPQFIELTGNENPFDGIVGYSSSHSPIMKLIDLDEDSDLDLAIQNNYSIDYYENIGTNSAAEFTNLTGTDNPFNVITPYFLAGFDLADVDLDGDLDLITTSLISYTEGDIFYYENKGTETEPLYELVDGVESPFDGINPGAFSTVKFVDLDNDLDFDVLFSEIWGKQNYFKNTINTPIKISENSKGVEVYPNPSDNFFFVDMQNIDKIEVYDITGKIIFSENINSDKYLLDLSENTSGIYILKIVAEGKTFNHKLVLN